MTRSTLTTSRQGPLFAAPDAVRERDDDALRFAARRLLAHSAMGLTTTIWPPLAGYLWKV